MGTLNTAVILAAGLGTRLRSVTGGEIPKGFLKVNNLSLIERSLEKLISRGMEKIIIVTGHLSHFYDELAGKYPQVETIKNDNYADTGSMASLACARPLMGESFLLLESDLIYESRALDVLLEDGREDCILLSGFTKSGDEVFVEARNESLYRMSKKAGDLDSIEGELTGLNKISLALYQRMIAKFGESTNPQYHYEYAVTDSASDDYPVGYSKIDDLIWAEIDDETHLARVEREIIPRLRKRGEEKE